MEIVYKINDEHRKQLSLPPCRIFESKDEVISFIEKIKPFMITCIGDFVSDEFNGIWKNAVIDNKTMRKPYKRSKKLDFKIKFFSYNPAGVITKHAWESVKKCFCFSSKCLVEIKGEEDLLGFPALYFSPKNSLVIFGLPGKRIGCFYTNEIHREFVKKFIPLEKEQIVLVGGTFSYFHAGHKYFLLSAFEIGKKVYIGVTSDEFAKKLKSYNVPEFEKRVEKIENFIKEFGFENRCEITELNDVYGISTEIEKASILVTPDLEKRAKEINQIRKRKGLENLKVFVIEKLKAKNGKCICCKRILKGEINEEGL
ncbi:MAG TPA: DUF359 domain-containing protein [Nanoarchaeota archaeon]|nr:DUF359 domain-containing protein [Nanoarchaeota archaeon]